jgi:peptidoglycan/LPS O-acetylase OafA/YrhL
MTNGPIAEPKPTDSPLHPTYRPDVDGLRALAIVPVVAFHAFPSIAPGGFVGVDVFFVISGYLISSIIFGGLERGRFSLRRFYIRRIKRIFPALVLVLFTCLVWGWFGLFSDDYALVGKHVAGGAGFIANFLYWNEAGYFDFASETKPLLHLWSLGIEEQFYLIWPSLLLLCWHRGVPLAAVIAVLFAVSFGVNVVQVRSDEVAAFYAPWTRLWELLLGSGLAYLSRPRVMVRAGVGWQSIVYVSPAPALRHAASAAGLLAVLAAVALFSADTSFPGWRAALPAGGTLLILAAGPEAWLNRYVLSRRALVWIGLISYPLYLWHWPLLSFARIAEAGTPPAATRIAIVAVSVVLAWATYALVERRIRFRPTGRAVVPALCALTFAAGLGGYVTYAAAGFVDRPINRSDRAHFLQYYARMRTNGTLKSAYRWECDFLDWDTEKNRDAIDPSCTQPGANGTVFLWGDSHGQALSLGVRSALPPGFRLAQVTTSGCAPRLSEVNPEALSGRCRRANGYALERIAAIKPDVVLLAQILAHTETGWESIAADLRSRGAREVILVGPAPQWHPSLPLVVTRDHWTTGFDRVKEGFNQEVLTIDRALQVRLGRSTAIRYVSLLDALCNDMGCLATVPGTDRQLITVDSGHFSPAGSVYVADTILRPYVPVALRSP